MARERIILNCPFSEKEECKRLGGRWDKNIRKWYVPAGKNETPFQKWIPGFQNNDLENAPIEDTKTVDTPRYLPDETFMQQMNEEQLEETKSKFEELRKRVLDLTRRNRLINTPLYGKTTPLLRVIDEQPDLLFLDLVNEKKFEFDALPAMDDDPEDEKNSKFIDVFLQAQLIDEQYSKDMDAIDPSDEDAEEQKRILDRGLKDKVREQLKMPSRPKGKAPKSLAAHAKQNNINPNYDLPFPEDKNDDGRHDDDRIQTLLLPKDLERVAQRIFSRSQSYQDETGINILQGAFGFLEWKESDASDKILYSPLILLPVKLTKKVSKGGFKFSVTGSGETPVLNRFLFEKLRRDFGIILPAFEDGEEGEEDGVESYLEKVSTQVELDKIQGRIRRFICFGDFRASQLALYEDLKPDQIIVTEIVDALLNGVGFEGSQSGFADEYETDLPEVAKLVPRVILDCDASQHSALVDVASGKNLALEGPPGTGKSQTIVNAIANAIYDGKKVLFVAAKKAAIEVVESRLNACGLGDFSLTIHPNESRKDFVASIKNRLEMEAPNVNEKDVQEVKSDLEIQREFISEYIDFLVDNNVSESESNFEVLGQKIKYQEPINDLPRKLRQAKLDDFFVDFFSDTSIAEDIKSYQLALDELTDVDTIWNEFLGQISSYEANETIDDCKDTLEDAYKIKDLFAYLIRNKLINCEQDDLLNYDISKELELAKAIEVSFEISPDIADLFFEKNGALKVSMKELENCLNIYKFLPKQIIKVPALEKLDALINSIKTLEFFEVDIPTEKEISQSQKLNSKYLRQAKKILPKLAEFLENSPREFSDIPLMEFKAAFEVLQINKEELLSIKRDSKINKIYKSHLVDQLELVGIISDYTKQLKDKVSLSPDISLDELKLHVQVTQKPSFILDFFNGQLRKSKQFYYKVKRGDLIYDRTEASEILEQLYLLKVAEKRFDELTFNSFIDEISITPSVSQKEREKAVKHIELYRNVINNNEINELETFLLDDITIISRIPSILETTDDDLLGLSYKTLLNWADKTEPHINVLENISTQLNHIPKNLSSNLNTQDLKSLVKKLIKFNEKISEIINTDERLEDFLNLKVNKVSDIVIRIETLKTLVHALSQSEKLDWSKTYINSNRKKENYEKLESFNKLKYQIHENLSNLQKLDGMSGLFNLDNPFDEIINILEKSVKSGHFLIQVARKNTLREAKNISPFLNLVEETFDEPQDLLNIAKLLACNFAAKKIEIEETETLKEFTSVKLNKARSKFTDLDERSIKLNQSLLAKEAFENSSPPYGNSRGRKSSYTDLGLLRHQSSLTRNFKSPRYIVSNARDALLELKPCWMMSPLAVAQYVDKRKLQFDLVIIDEASQMEPHMAMGAVMRGKQLIVVGDQNQLPPTRFFNQDYDTEDIDEDIETSEESILQMANLAFHPKRRLRWHYRSKDSNLISYSNYKIYDNSLIVFPNPAINDKNLGVSQVFVENAVYRAGTNPLEAEAILEGIVSFMKTNPDKSLGVVVMNVKQRDLIQQMFDLAHANDNKIAEYCEYWEQSNLGLEKFFIKNIENVQGDERDAIFIGTVYGPEVAGGKVRQNFGPINKVDGRRRLNVLFSRSKHQMVTFTSLKPSDVIDSKPGSEMFAGWLSYSATGELIIAEKTFKEPDSPFEEHVISLLIDAGYDVDPQVGASGYFIDIGVKHQDYPYGYIMGVECDGATYHSSKSSRDRDRLRQQVLEGLGWQFYRIWSTDWFQNPKQEFEKLDKALKQRLKELASRTPQSVPVAIKEKPKTNLEIANLPSDEKTPPQTSDFQDSSLISYGSKFKLNFLDSEFDNEIYQIAEIGEKPNATKGVIARDSSLGQSVWELEDGEIVRIPKKGRVYRVEVEIL